MRTHEGVLDGRGLRVALVASRFNEVIVRTLVDGAADCLRRHGVPDDDLELAWVPGASSCPWWCSASPTVAASTRSWRWAR